MPPRIVPILNRLRQDIAADLATDTIEEACRQTNHSWRKRLLDPATTVYLFLLQILHGNTACQHVAHFGGWSFTDSASCQARERLPLAAFHGLLEKAAATFRSATAEGSRWLGHRVWLVDGSSSSMPDAPELQRHFGQPGGQRQGCGFPVAKGLALFDLTTGMLLRTATASLRSHEMSPSAAISQGLEPGDLVLGDRGSCSSAHLALVIQRELHAVFRIPTEADCRLHSRPPAGATRVKGPAGPAAFAVGAGAGRLGSGRRLVQAEGQTVVDDGAGVCGAAG